MSVDSTHPQYDRHIAIWRKCRDVAQGEEAVKARGTDYLPRLGGQDEDEYAAFKQRALYLNATGRTVDGLSGMVFRKRPQVEHPTALDDFMADVDQAGMPFLGLAENVVDEVLKVGRYGVLVDYPHTEESVRTVAQASADGLRPFVKTYHAEDILYWRTGQVGNRTELVQVRLQESVSEAQDEFTDEEIEQIRVLELVEGAYQQRVFRKNDGEWTLHETITPVRNGQPLERIPFFFVGPKDSSWNVDKPPLLDLVNVNVKHYQRSADYAHGLHFVALPTPYLFGVNDEEKPEAIGPTNLWISRNAEAQAGMLEYTGAGLESIMQSLERLEHNMAVLGARMLESEKRQVEAAETAQIHRSGEHSVLASLALAVSDVLTQVLVEVSAWYGAEGDASVELNRDYVPVPMSPQMLTALVGALQSGSIPRRVFLANLQRGEIVDADVDVDELIAEMETSDPFGARNG